MTAFTERIPGTLIRPGWEQGCLTTATWLPNHPESVVLSFAEDADPTVVTAVTAVSRDAWYAGTEAPRCEPGKLIYPVQCKDVHWTVMQVQIAGAQPFAWYVQTWRVTDFVVATHQTVPTSWADDFEDLADDAAFDAWLRGLVGTP